MNGVLVRKHNATLIVLSVLAILLSSYFQLAYWPDTGKPAFAQEPDSDDTETVFPPIRSSTASAAYTIELDWQPETPGTGHETIYLVKFLDENGRPVQHSVIGYDFEILSIEGGIVKGFYNQETEDDGVGRPLIIEFEAGGPISISVYIHSALELSSGNVTPIDEGVTFAMTIVPEFSASVLLLVMPAVIGMVVLLNRLRFFSQENTRI